MRFLFFIHLFELYTVVLGIDFINPAPFGTDGDFSLNALYPIGSQLNVQWTALPPGNRSVLAMFQSKEIGSEFFGDFEYIQRMSSQWLEVSCCLVLTAIQKI